MYFKNKYITNPAITPSNAIVQVFKELTNALKGIGAPSHTQAGINQL